jgi:hypothetical protein
MNDDQIIDQIIHSFSQYNLRDIEEINNHEKLEFTIFFRATSPARDVATNNYVL